MKTWFVALALVVSAAGAQASVCSDLFSSAPKRAGDLLDVLRSQGSVQTFEGFSGFQMRRSVTLDVGTQHLVRAKADAIADELAAHSYDDRRFVLYPAAGFDAGTPFRIFRHAEMVVGLDKHPFVDEGTRRRSVSAPKYGSVQLGEWAFVTDVDKLGETGNSIAASILTLAPGHEKGAVRIRRMQVIRTGRVDSDGAPIVHGIVEFDTGADTPLRRYVHIQTPIEITRSKIPASVQTEIEAVIQSNFDTIFAKASMSFFANPHVSFGGLLVEKLRHHGGLIVDTDVVDPAVGGMASHPAWPFMANKASMQPDDVTIVSTDIGALGYGGTSFVKFAGQSVARSDRLIAKLAEPVIPGSKTWIEDVQVNSVRAVTWSRKGALKAIFGSDKLSEALAVDAHQFKQPRTVVYAAAGFDAGLPFRVFRDADTVIGIDDHPFIQKDRQGRRQNASGYAVLDEGALMYADQVGAAKSMADSIVAAILRFAPGHPTRIRKVQAIHTDDRVGGYDAVHGVVEFDMGEGTPLRRYIHIHSGFGRFNGYPPPEWLKSVVELGIDGLFIKAAMSMYPGREVGEWPTQVIRADKTSFGYFLFKTVAKQGGVIVDTDSTLHRYELELKEHGAITRHVGNISLGYSDSVDIIRFERKAR